VPRQAGRAEQRGGVRLVRVTTSCVDLCRALARPSAPKLAVVGMLLVSGTLMAVSPRVAHGAAIHACYNRASGALRWVASGRHCRRGEAQISWNLAGRAGAQGPVGPPGFLGVQGVAGASGPRGETGATGQTPEPGLTGPTGPEVPGATGAPGSPGTPGEPSSVTGATGATGANGAAGATGTTGPTGPSEGLGTIGPTGPTGPGLPATKLGTEKETGAWIVTTPHKAEVVPGLEGDNISFPVPLAHALSAPPTGCEKPQGKPECHVKWMTKEETKQIANGEIAMPGCKAAASPVAGEPTERDRNLLEKPEAEPGNLCAYTGVEETGETATVMTRQPILSLEGPPGASRTGAWIGYADEETLTGGFVRAQGSWAVR
jgi:hypothetical protein